MNVDNQKKLADFTTKQRKAFRAVMREISNGDIYQSTKISLVAEIRKSGAYEREHDAVKALKMMLKNPHIPLRRDKELVKRTDMPEGEE